jgi:hypothetical protein
MQQRIIALRANRNVPIDTIQGEDWGTWTDVSHRMKTSQSVRVVARTFAGLGRLAMLRVVK